MQLTDAWPESGPIWLLTCRHNFEDVLAGQLQSLTTAKVSRVLSGLLAVEGLEPGLPASHLDPSYALQVMPDCHKVEHASVRGLARAIVDVIAEPIDGVDGPWDLHVLLPAQLRGNPKPPMARRAGLLREAVIERLSGVRRRAAKRLQTGCGKPVRLVQVLLLNEQTCWVSCVKTEATAIGGTWPVGFPAGHADVADDDGAPASSYRKLEEALACMQHWPSPGETAVDLGACPGGWTRVMRRNGARVDAIDRQPVAKHLMRDRKIRFTKADAFTWRPERPVDWLVSDVVAYPDRILELIDTWAGERLATRIVVQMKFRGEPDHSKIADGMARLRAAGYGARVRHFFNDKNEVTLMAVHSSIGDQHE
ncbi:MAG: hypothetical protein KC502_09540 [Myxococcales bacterium]|nr:hypothetical protein [Myxococcales bacterium]